KRPARRPSDEHPTRRRQWRPSRSDERFPWPEAITQAIECPRLSAPDWRVDNEQWSINSRQRRIGQIVQAQLGLPRQIRENHRDEIARVSRTMARDDHPGAIEAFGFAGCL